MRARRPPRRFACAIAVLAFLATAAPASAGELRPVIGPLKTKIGIADQKPSAFSDERLIELGLGYARRSVAWNALRFPRQRDDLDAWIAGVESMGAEPLITLARPTERVGGPYRPPTASQFLREFLRFRTRYPQVRTYSAWNEANFCGSGTCRNPEIVARYFNLIRQNCLGCKVVAADVLDQPNMVSWVRAFRRAAKIEPRYWGLHDYIDANRFQTTRTVSLLKAVKGEVWLTEVGGLVARRNRSTVKLPAGKAHATLATKFIFQRLARLSPRIARIYVYHWSSSASDDSWDSAFVGANDVARPALTAFKRFLP